MVDAIVAELETALRHWEDETFHTLYFGGGTPSILGPHAIDRIARVAFDRSNWSLDEWTLEANPEDLEIADLEAYLKMGINRLSIGAQSFDAEVLRWMRRVHGIDRAENAVRHAAEAGFSHISLDLMYGLPVGGDGRWERDLGKACALPVDHLSCYILTAEKQTLYGHQLETGTMVEPPEEQVLSEYAALCRATREAGFEHYEVSNFARTGGRSQHNSAYWNGIPYLGVGPGAHSFKADRRWWNMRSNAGYMRHAKTGKWEGQQEFEQLGATAQFNEALITGLRRQEGVDPVSLEERTGLTLGTAVNTAIQSGDCEWIDGRLRIPESRWPMGDAITLGLMR